LLLTFAVLVCSACRSREPSQPYFLAALAPSSSRVVLDDETRLAIEAPHPSRVAFDVRVPEEPVFRFAIAAKPLGEPGHWPPLEFRIFVESDGGEREALFEDQVARGQESQWLDRELDLRDFQGRNVRLVLETAVSGPEARQRRAGLRVMPVWGNPVISSRSRRDERPTIVLVSIDTLRADHLGSYGYHRETSPRLDGFAEDAALFESASSVSSWTLPTHLSMLTGLMPSLHGVREQRRLSSDIAFLPELMAESGYRVDGVTSWYFLSQEFGFDRGFHSYRLRVDQRAKEAVDTAIGLIDRAEGQAHFLFLHLVDPHWPYLPPGEWAWRFGRPRDVTDALEMVAKRRPPRDEADVDDAMRLYDAEIAYMDSELGRFFDALKSRGLYDDALIIVTSDHGEGFYEHDHWGHMVSLYDEMTRIPLIVKWPKGKVKGRFATAVSQTDVFPTILEAAGLAPPETAAVSLLRSTDHEEDDRAVLSELSSADGMKVSCASASIDAEECRTLAVRFRAMKAIATLVRDGSETRTAKQELYDLFRDPHERTDLSATEPARAEALLGRLRDFVIMARSSRVDGEEVVLDEEQREKLRSLGYIQ
jgi:arylsulfatase A-like enzyme